MPVKIGAACVRVSTDDQTEYSPESQIKLIREYAGREGYVIPDEYIFRDDGISGKRADKRPAFRLMIATAKQSPPPFDTIFVWKFSRFARNQEESIVYKNLLKKNGVSVRSISEPSSDDNPFSSLIERIIEWMDEYYVINLANEVRRGMTEKSTRGEAMGRPPFGYRVENKKFVPDENAEIVRWIFEQYSAGRSKRDIAVELGNRGIQTKAKKPMNIYTVSYILKNPAYIGKIRWSTESHERYFSAKYTVDEAELTDGQHEAIISRDLWNAAQERGATRDTETKYVRKDNPSVYMLKGLIRCSDCGATLTERKEKKALQCYRYSRGQCRSTHYIQIKKANETVIENLAEIVRSESFTFSPRPAPKSQPPRDWDKLIASEEARLKRAKTGYLDGVFTADEVKSIQAEVETNIARLAESKAEMTSDPSRPVDITAFKQKTLDVLEILSSPDINDAAKNQALRSILDKIVYDKPHQRFDFYFIG